MVQNAAGGNMKVAREIADVPEGEIGHDAAASPAGVVGRVERLLFPLLLLGPVAHASVLILQHRLPNGHDTFELFTIQWYFLSNAAASGEIAQWVPYLTHGMIATYWYGFQASLLQDVLLPAGALLRGVDVLPIFHLTLLVEELFLASGCWLLARRLFGSRITAFFVGTTVLGTSLWMDQVWTFRFIYAAPLVLYLGHRLLDSGHWRYLLLAGNLLAFQSIGNVPYFIPVTSLAIVVYFVSQALLDGGESWRKIRRLRWDWRAAASLAFVAFSIWGTYRYLTIGTEWINTVGRNPDGTVPLDSFLVYGGRPGLRRWIDLVTRLKTSLDNSRYAGMLTVPLAVAGVAFAGKRYLHLSASALFLLIFAMGGAVASALYFIWPGMNYYRHLTMVSAYVRLFLCFVAGVGFQRLFLDGSLRWRNAAAALLAAAMFAISLGLFAVRNSAETYAPLLRLLRNAASGAPDYVRKPKVIGHRLDVAMALALLSGVVLAAASRSHSPRERRAVTAAALLLAAGDVWQFKFEDLAQRSEVVPEPVRSLTRTFPIPFHPARAPGAAAVGPRIRQLSSFHDFEGVTYWTVNMFVLEDHLDSPYRTDYWLLPFDQFQRAFWHQSLRDRTERTRGSIPFGKLRVPTDVNSVNKLSGYTQPKLQLFSAAYALADETGVASLMTEAPYDGDLLFLQADDVTAAAAGIPRWTGQRPLGTSDRLDLRYEVRRFDANNLVVDVENPRPGRSWLYYADTWHPFWRASVNGATAPLFRAAIAYKAVPVGPGSSRVHFRFGSREAAAWAGWHAIQSCFWLAVLVLILAREFMFMQSGREAPREGGEARAA